MFPKAINALGNLFFHKKLGFATEQRIYSITKEKDCQ